ncbi:hypothetical protein [Sphingomonas bacterium]|uniref:hypothetical protein n=1 Tax=Sphingomonas bacterium TaxID=1895847 RepID=UPI00261F9443|nr:hypothetical protein [Sphingomonas bacterium]
MFFLILPIFFGILAYNMRRGLMTGVIQYGRAFGRPLVVEREKKPVGFRVLVAIHILFMGFAVADLVYLMVSR